MIANLDVSKINAGNISTNKFRIVSDNGGIEIVGATQQFKDKNNKVRIQMGQDAKGNFNFILRGEDGTTTLIDHTGIKEKAIADNLIKGNMVATDAIGEKQINYSSLITGLNKDTNTQLIKASKVAIDFVGQSLEVAFNSLKNQADNAKLLIENHSTTIGVMQGQINTAINNTQIVKDGKTILLKDDYNRTVSKVDSINSTIGTHTTKINELTGNITSVDTKVNSIQRDLEGTKSTVSSHTNLIDGLNSKVSTQGSSIEQLKNQITLKVNSTELTTMKNELIGKIDSIEIGGRNTLLNATGNLGNTNYWSNVVLDTNKKVEGCNSFKITRNNFANGNARYQGSQTIDLSRLSLKANDYITLSGWVYVDSSINLTGSSNEFAFRNYYNSSASFEDLCVFKYANIQKNTWTKFSVTSKVTKDSYKAGALLLSISANGLIYVSKLKLEKGSKATDFTLAPEDVDSAIGTKANKTDVYVKSEVYTKAQTDSAINIAKDSINLGVSQTYETKTNVTSKINTAKTEAVNTSKSYADAKKTEAITSANNYADNKKAEAIVQAGKDADSKVNSAKTELNNKIDLKASKTDVYTKSETYTKTETDSKIKVAKDEINLSVSNNYETKTNVENKLSNITTTLTNKIDGIQIGGRNLFLKSNIDQYGLGNWIGNSGGIGKVEGTFIDGTKTIKVTIQYNSFIKLKRNTTYVYSMMMKSSGSMIVNSSNPLHMWLNTSETGGQHLEKVISASGKLEANKWTKVWVVFETPNTQDVYYMKPFVYGIDTNTVYISKVQIEEGTKATDWTPAPEDIDSVIGTKANKTDVYTKSETYTKSQTDSAIKVAKDSIELGVKNTYETKSNVENKISTAVSKIQIGGRNLAYKETIKPFSSSTLVLAEYVKNGKLILTRPTGNGDGGFYFDKLIKYKENSEYIVHFYMTCTKDTVENIHFHNGQNLNSTRIYIDDIYVGNIGNVINTSVFDDGLSHKVRMEYTTPSTLVDSSAGVNQTYFQPNKMLSNNTYTVIIEEFMVEEGTKASSWTPAPEDVTVSIDSKANKSDVYAKSETYSKTETDSKINVAKDSINLGVSQTYETKTNVTSKVNTAKTEAVNISKSYADTKKTEAINSANATTTEKLKSYSTTAQMNSAIQVAKDSITNTVSSTYAKKADVESTYATKSSLTQTANNITASFKASGGYNLIANSTGYNGTKLWTSGGATMGTATNNNIGGATNMYMYLDNELKPQKVLHLVKDLN